MPLIPGKKLKATLQNVGEKLLGSADVETSPLKLHQKTTISNRVIDNIKARILMDKRIRRKLPIWGYLNIDRQLPFLIIYRRPMKQDDPGTSRLIVSEACFNEFCVFLYIGHLKINTCDFKQ